MIMLMTLLLQTAPDPDTAAVAAAAAAAAAAVLKTAEATRSGFSDPIVIAMIGTQVVLAIGAIGSAVGVLLNRHAVKTMQEQTTVNTAGLLVVAKDTEAIKGHVNSEKTAAEGRAAALRQENALLREMLADKKLTAQLLAQAVATRQSRAVRATDPAGVVAAPDDPAAAASVAHLEHIDENTAATAESIDALLQQTTAEGRP